MAKTLSELLTKNVRLTNSIGNTDKVITKLCLDSRQVTTDSLFAALTGTQTDGHQFIELAIERGATVVLCEQLPNHLADHVTYLQAPDAAAALGLLAHHFFDQPSRQLQLVGVTGTNGKTTTATLLFKLFRSLGYSAGLLSTVQYQINDTILPASHTTPDVISLHELLAQMVEAGCDYAFMEVSSHAVDQQRIAGITFAGGIFTNITHDHLDYHGTFDRYIKAKKGFFDALPANAFALTNLDDKRGKVMLQNTAAKKAAYSLKTLADFKAQLPNIRLRVWSCKSMERKCIRAWWGSSMPITCWRFMERLFS